MHQVNVPGRVVLEMQLPGCYHVIRLKISPLGSPKLTLKYNIIIQSITILWVYNHQFFYGEIYA